MDPSSLKVNRKVFVSLQTYGLPAGYEQHEYDQRAFAMRLSTDHGCPPRVDLFKRCAESILPGHFEYHEWTNRLIWACCNRMLVGIPGCAGSAKAQPLDSVVWTPSGPKRMGDIKAGDRVCNATGGCSVVLGVFPQGEKDVYEIELSDGRVVRSTEDHLWTVGLTRHDWDWKLKTITLADMMGRKPALDRRGTKFTIPKPSAVWMDYKDVPMDPYLLGVLVGDGCFSGRHVLFATGDEELLSLVKSKVALPYQVRWLGRCDYCINIPGNRWSALKGKKRTGNRFKDALKSLGLWGLKSSSKFIPDCYLHNSIGVRSEVLRGLLDTDGTASKDTNSVVFCTTSMRLAECLRTLVESLGGACRISPQQTFYSYLGKRKAGQLSYRCTIEHPRPDTLFHLSRKRSRLKPRQRANGVRYINDIRYVGTMPVQCIRVSAEDHHYLTDGFVVTHNTYNIANFAAVWWLCDPTESSVILVSTSRESLRKRAWAEISRCYSSAPEQLRGAFTDSRMIWSCLYGDARHAIFGKAVEEGSITKVADDIKGIHTRRQMVVIDEATSVPEAIFDACSNLFSYPEEFLMVVIGNPRNRLDQFSKFIEPAEGWTSVSVDDEEWEGKPQHEYGGAVPLVIRFDAEKSPNITEGRIVSRHLPLPHTVEARKKAAGGQTPLWWSNFRGFPPPEGICKTVFSESVIASQKAASSFLFSGDAFQIVGGFDHARNGGDRPVLRFSKLGLLQDGKLGLEWMPPITLELNSNSTVPIDFQLANQVKLHCEHFVYKGVDYHCPPENLGVDATGEGAGFADILQRTFSPRVVRVVFSAAASDEATSLEDMRPACEVYENKRAEIYFRSRDLLNHGQLRGVDRETSVEFCTLEFDDSGKRIKLQSKKDYKKKFRKSPDYADSAVICCEVARLRGLKLVPQGETVQRYEDFEQTVEDCNAVFANAAYEPEELSDYV